MGVVSNLADFAKAVGRYGSWQAAVEVIVGRWFVSGLIGIATGIGGILLMPFSILGSSLTGAGSEVAGAFGVSGSAVLSPVTGLESTFQSIAAGAGVFAPVVVLLGWALVSLVVIVPLWFLLRYLGVPI